MPADELSFDYFPQGATIPESVAAEQLASMFVDQLAAHWPEVWENLVQSVFPVFVEYSKSNEVCDYSRCTVELKESIENWARAHHFLDAKKMPSKWLCRYAFRALAEWRNLMWERSDKWNPGEWPLPKFYGLLKTRTLLTLPAFTIELPTPNLQFGETFDQYLQRIRPKLRDHFTKVYEGHGRTVQWQKHSNATFERRLEHLILHLRGKTWAEIAAMENFLVDEDTLRATGTHTARLLLIRLTRRGGRPRKTENRSPRNEVS